MIWWIWVVLGVLLLGLEVLTPGGFFIFFFGAAAIIIGIVDAVLPDLPLATEVLLFSALSATLLVLFRKRLLERFAQPKGRGDVDSLQGSVCTAIDEINPNSFGKVEARGTVWSARNIGTLALSKGERCTIQLVEGLLLHVRREEQ